MKKQFKWTAWVAAILLVIAGLTFGSSTGKIYAEVKDEEAYQQVMEQDVAYLYFGRDTCPYCQAFEPLLEEAVKETGTEVYYYDTDAHKGDADFQDILAANEVVTVPKLVRLEQGKVTDFVDHTNKQSEITILLSGK